MHLVLSNQVEIDSTPAWPVSKRLKVLTIVAVSALMITLVTGLVVGSIITALSGLWRPLTIAMLFVLGLVAGGRRHSWAWSIPGFLLVAAALATLLIPQVAAFIDWVRHWANTLLPRQISPWMIPFAFAAAGAFLLGLFSLGRAAYTCTIALLAALLVCLVLPIVLATAEGFVDGGHFSLRWIGRTLSDSLYLRQLGNSLAVACCTTALAMAIALGPAILRARYRFAGSGVLGALMLVPMILPPFVGALSMRHLLSQFGSLNLLLERIGILDFAKSLPPDWLGGGFAGVALLQSLHLFPILYLNASAALANVDSAYQQAARNLGASSWQTFTRVTLPLIRPGLFAGGTIVFIWSFTDIGTPLILNYDPLTAVTIFKEISRSETSPTVYSLVFVLLSSSVSLYVLGKYLFGRGFEAQTSKGATRSELRPLSVLGTAGAWCLYGGIIVLALLPHVGVVLTAFSGRWVNTVLPDRWTLEHVAFAITRPETVLSIKNSTLYAAASTGLDLAIGGLVAWLIVRARPRGKGLLDGLVMLPLAVPGLILAAGFVAMTAGGPLKPIGPVGAYAFVILIVAYTVRRLPFAVRGIAAGLEQVPVSLEEAARNLGAGPFTTARRVTLPLIAASAIAAGVLTFSFAVLEVSDSLVLAQTMNVYPITKEIYIQATSGNPDAANIAAALGVYGMVLLGATLATASALLGKRLGAIFRA